MPKKSFNGTNYEQTTKKENQFNQSERKFKVVMKFNFPFELYVNRELLKWNAYGINPWHPEKYKSGIPESIINSKAFQNARNYFTIIPISEEKKED